jgi:hypothetical protein
VLWIRLGFNVDPDLDPDQTFESQKVEFLHKNIINVGNRSKTYIRRYKRLVER